MIHWYVISKYNLKRYLVYVFTGCVYLVEVCRYFNNNLNEQNAKLTSVTSFVVERRTYFMRYKSS